MLHFPSHLKPLKVRGILVVAALAVAPPLIHAQTPPDRTALERFRDSLASLSDSTGLLALEKHLIDSAKTNRSDGLLHLRLGFISCAWESWADTRISMMRRPSSSGQSICSRPGPTPGTGWDWRSMA